MKKIFAANWKLHKSPDETRAFFTQWNAKAPRDSDKQFVFFPPASNWEATARSLQSDAGSWGSQNCYFEEKGAFTGENSPTVLRELGGRWCLVGHSERRQIFSEQDSTLAKKVQKLQALGLTPLFCLGETLEERDKGQTLNVLKTQLEKGLALADRKGALVLAYEPVWAIGTGRVAQPEQVAEAHAFLAKQIHEMGFSSSTPLLYGGSVKPENAQGLSGLSHVHGFLVGGASLEVDSFLAIAR